MTTRRRAATTAARRLLGHVFGLDEFRPGQEDIIGAVLAGRDTVGIMPTGAGKLLCYQIPALLMRGTTLVISPLISLMKDQTDKLVEMGLAASVVNSTLTAREESAELARIASDRAEFVLTTPERLATNEFRDMLRRTTLDLIVVVLSHLRCPWRRLHGAEWSPPVAPPGVVGRQHHRARRRVPGTGHDGSRQARADDGVRAERRLPLGAAARILRRRRGPRRVRRLRHLS